jgi:hypothetical protein
VRALQGAAGPGGVVLDQAIVAAAGGEEVLDLAVKQAEKHEAPLGEGRTEATERADEDLVRYPETLGIRVYLLEMSQCGGGSLEYVGAFEQLAKPVEGAVGSVCISPFVNVMSFPLIPKKSKKKKEEEEGMGREAETKQKEEENKTKSRGKEKRNKRMREKKKTKKQQEKNEKKREKEKKKGEKRKEKERDER